MAFKAPAWHLNLSLLLRSCVALGMCFTSLGRTFIVFKRRGEGNNQIDSDFSYCGKTCTPFNSPRQPRHGGRFCGVTHCHTVVAPSPPPFFQIFPSPQVDSVPVNSDTPSPFPRPTVTPLLISVSMNSTVVGISYRWSHTTLVLL